MQIKNKNILIIGASGGIGECLVKLLKTYNNLILTGRKFTNNFSDSKLLTHHLDVSKQESIYALSEKISKLNITLDGIIFNAGINHFMKLDYTSVDNIQEIINVNLIGCILTNKILLKNLKQMQFAFSVIHSRVKNCDFIS
jgi:short-subunit dehydrogenase